MENIKELAKNFVIDLEELIKNQNNGKFFIDSTEIEISDALEAITQLEHITSCKDIKNIPNLNIPNHKLMEEYSELNILINQLKASLDRDNNEVVDLDVQTKFAFIVNAAEEIYDEVQEKIQENAKSIQLDFGEVDSNDLEEFFSRIQTIFYAETADEIPDLNDINPIILEEYQELAFFVRELKNPTMNLDNFLQAEASLSY